MHLFVDCSSHFPFLEAIHIIRFFILKNHNFTKVAPYPPILIGASEYETKLG